MRKATIKKVKREAGRLVEAIREVEPLHAMLATRLRACLRVIRAFEKKGLRS